MIIALLGTGRMGKLIEQLAFAKGMQIGFKKGRGKEEGNLATCDVLIDFSSPDALDAHLDLALSHKKPLVIGTTGWNGREEEVRKKIERSGIGCVAAPNFSIGVALFLEIVNDAAKLISHYDEYDVAGFELHHSKKLDAPSGTAKALEKELAKSFKRPIAFSSLRVGSVPGEHSVLFDSPDDTITLTHTARSRKGFALGALRAAEWIQTKKGYYTLREMMEDEKSLHI